MNPTPNGLALLDCIALVAFFHQSGHGAQGRDGLLLAGHFCPLSSRILERVDHLQRGLETLVGLAFERHRAHVRKRLVKTADCEQTWNRLDEQSAQRLRLGRATEQPTTAERLPHHDADAEKIRAPIDGVSFRLLGRHVGEFSLHRTVARVRDA